MKLKYQWYRGKMHLELYMRRLKRASVMGMLKALAKLGKGLIAIRDRLIEQYADLAYDDKNHTTDAYIYLRDRDYRNAFSRGWCYSLAAAGEAAGIGTAVCFGRPILEGMNVEICHAAVRLPDGRFVDIAGAHDSIEELQEASFPESKLELYQHSATKEAAGFIIVRSIWLGVNPLEMEKLVNEAMEHVFGHWRGTNYASYPQKAGSVNQN